MRRSLVTAGTALLTAALVFVGVTPASAADITVVYTGTIDPVTNPADSYFVYLEAGESIDVAMTCPDGALDPYVLVYLGDEEVADFDDEGVMDCATYYDALGTYVADATGIYEIVATFAATSAGAYQLTLTYPEHVITFTNANAVTVDAGAALSLPLSTDSTDPVIYSLSAGTLPAGVTLVDGVIAGTPTIAGVYTVEVTAATEFISGSQSITFTVVSTLAATGVDIVTISLGGVALLAAGGILLYTRRRYSL